MNTKPTILKIGRPWKSIYTKYFRLMSSYNRDVYVAALNDINKGRKALGLGDLTELPKETSEADPIGEALGVECKVEDSSIRVRSLKNAKLLSEAWGTSWEDLKLVPRETRQPRWRALVVFPLTLVAFQKLLDDGKIPFLAKDERYN